MQLTVSQKLKSAAVAMRGGLASRPAASYLESDVLRDVTRGNLACRPELLRLIASLRDETASLFDAALRCESMAADCMAFEHTTMTRGELEKQLRAEYERGLNEGRAIAAEHRAEQTARASADRDDTAQAVLAMPAPTKRKQAPVSA